MATTRGRIVFMALTLFIIYFLFIASPTSQSEKEYRQRTEDGLARRRSKMQGDISDQEWTRQTNEKLRAILETHPHGSRGNKNVGSTYDTVVKGDSEDAEKRNGGSKYQSTQDQNNDHTKPKYPKPVQDGESEDDSTFKGKAGVAGSRERLQKGMGRASSNAKKEKEAGGTGKDLAREQLQIYLKKPVVIFSKSYCPHSKRAKQLLTEVYTITPAPLIVELDELTELVPQADEASSGEDHHAHAITMGRQIQDLLGEITGRTTVPNIIVAMNSIGGNDLIWDLHENGELAGTIQKLAGKRVTVELKGEHSHGRET